MYQFLNSILSSIVAGIILLFLAGIFSTTIRRLFIGALSKVLDIDIDYVFPDKKTCEKTLK